jgi:hypothetical protein
VSDERTGDFPDPIEFARSVKRELAAAQSKGAFQTSRGPIKVPINMPPVSIRDATTCPGCGAKKLAPRPHQPNQSFCFGCGRIER